MSSPFADHFSGGSGSDSRSLSLRSCKKSGGHSGFETDEGNQLYQPKIDVCGTMRLEMASLAERWSLRFQAEGHRLATERQHFQQHVRGLEKQIAALRSELKKTKDELQREREAKRAESEERKEESLSVCNWLLEALDPTEFEVATGSVCKCLQWRATHVGRVADGGIDLVVTNARGESGLVQCKQYKLTTRVTESQYRDLWGVVSAKGKDFALMATTNFATKSARQWIKEHGLEKRFHVWDRDSFAQWFADAHFRQRLLRQMLEDVKEYHICRYNTLQKKQGQVVAELQSKIDDLKAKLSSGFIVAYKSSKAQASKGSKTAAMSVSPPIIKEKQRKDAQKKKKASADSMPMFQMTPVPCVLKKTKGRAVSIPPATVAVVGRRERHEWRAERETQWTRQSEDRSSHFAPAIDSVTTVRRGAHSHRQSRSQSHRQRRAPHKRMASIPLSKDGLGLSFGKKSALLSMDSLIMASDTESESEEVYEETRGVAAAIHTAIDGSDAKEEIGRIAHSGGTLLMKHMSAMTLGSSLPPMDSISNGNDSDEVLFSFASVQKSSSGGSVGERQRRVWSERDDAVLLQCVQRLGEDWEQIQRVGNFEIAWNKRDLRSHWKRVLRPKLHTAV